MTEKTNKRSGMLGTIYKMLPNIDDDYAAKIVYTLENKKTVEQLQQDIADTYAQLGEGGAMADTIVAKIILDEITLPAALRQLRIYNNALAVSELSDALNISPQDTDLLLNVYASFGSVCFFDAEFAAALRDVRDDQNLPDEKKALHALEKLISQAKKTNAKNRSLAAKNQTAVYRQADKYRLSFKITAARLSVYTLPGAADFEQQFEELIKLLNTINPNERLNASLAAKTLLCQISAKDAQDITLTSYLVNGNIAEEDLMIIACRYLKVKTPQDILDSFDAVLKRLPHVKQKEENLGLSVQVLLDGTETSFEKARQKADLRRQRVLLQKALSQKDVYSGYEADLAHAFAGEKNFAQLEQDMNNLLRTLPHCQDEWENKELACKVLLGTLSHAEAQQQAEYLRGIKAKTLTKGLAPQALKNYLGTKPADEIITFFEQSLSDYTFWKSDQDKHAFALQTLVSEMNGTSNARISVFVLDMLEGGSSLEIVRDMLSNIQHHKNDGTELEKLLEMYRKASPSAQEA